MPCGSSAKAAVNVCMTVITPRLMATHLLTEQQLHCLVAHTGSSWCQFRLSSCCCVRSAAVCLRYSGTAGCVRCWAAAGGVQVQGVGDAAAGECPAPPSNALGWAALQSIV